MADNKTTIAVEVEVQGVEQSIESVKDLKNAIKAAKDEQVKMASAFGDGSKEYLDATKKLSGLKDKVDDLNDSTKSLKGTGVEQLTQGFAQMKDGIMNLDFDKVKGGIAAMKSGMGAFASSAKTALQGVKGALIATGIGALVVALGLIVAYWDDIKGLVSGVSSEQKKLNEDSAANLKLQQDKVAAISAQENILKLQGKSEREILQLKIKQTDEAITASEIAIQQAENTKKAQVDAAQRNKNILQGIIAFITAPITALLYGIDLAGKAFGQDFGLAEGFTGGLAEMVFDPEDVATEGDKVIAEAKAVNDKLKNDRAGLQLSVNKIDGDAEKTKIENQKKANEEAKKLRDEKLAAEISMRKQIEDAFIQSIKNEDQQKSIKSLNDKINRDIEINKSIVDEDLKNQALKASEVTFQTEMGAIYQAKLDKQKAADEKAAADKKALDAKILAETNAENTAASELKVLQPGNELQDLIDQLTVKRDIELQNKELTASQLLLIDEKYNQDVVKLNKDAENKKREDAFKIAQMGFEAAQQLTDLFFMFKKNKAEKGSKEELELAKKQFNVQKAFNLAKVAMDGAMAISNIIATTPKADFGVMTAVLLAGSAIATVTNMAKIAATKFDGGGASASGGGGGAAPMPSIPSPPTIATSNNNTNQTTSFDENGKNLDFKQPQINVTATVGVDEIAKKSNRVEVLEQQSTF